jgi:abequosyltransferase
LPDNPYIISFCIPTYNRAACLREAVESIIRQVDDKSALDLIEIVITDNGSEDGTAQVVDSLRSQTMIPIIYYRSDSNQGYDINLLKVIDLSRGRYCWLLGDDDRLAPGAVYQMLEEVTTHRSVDVFLCERDNYDLGFSNRFRFSPMIKADRAITFNFKKEKVSGYLQRVLKLPGIFSFISSMVFRREKWMAVAEKEKYIGSRYLHVYMFMAMLWSGEKGVLRYLPGRLALARWGNDRSFSPDALFERIKMDVINFHAMAQAVLGDARSVSQIDRIVLKNDAFSWIVRAKIASPKIFREQVWPFLLQYYRRQPLLWTKVFPLFLIPAFLLRFMRWAYRVGIKREILGPRAMFED